MPKVGPRIRQARVKAGLSLEAVGISLAKATGRKRPYTPQAVQQWELEDGTEPKQAVLVAFAKLAQVNLNWLLTGAVNSPATAGQGEYGTSARGGRVVAK